MHYSQTTKTQSQRENLEGSKRITICCVQMILNKLTIVFSSETTEAKMLQNDMFQVVGGKKKNQPRILYPAKLSSKMKEK